MDAQPEWHNIFNALRRGPRRLLTGADVACALRSRAVLLRWLSLHDARPALPLALTTQDRLRIWHREEQERASAEQRKPRFILKEIHKPPLALGWLASHQDDKFPGEPPVPNALATSVNHAADGAAA